MKNVIWTALLLLLTNISWCQAQTLSASRQNTLKKWINAVINVECTEYPRTNDINAVRSSLQASEIDTPTAQFKLDSLSANPNKTSGTAIFLKYKGQHFLLSARHIFADGGGDTMQIRQSIVLVEDMSRLKNDRTGDFLVDTPIRGDNKNIGNSGINILVAPGNTLGNFEYLDTSAERRSLTNLSNDVNAKTYYFSSVGDDIGIINLDTICK